MRRLALLALVAVISGCGDDPGNPLRVELDTGVVIGLDKEGVREFLRIPYAAAPVGELRFKPPQPPEPWDEERELIMPGDPCPQGVSFAGGGVEDCLFVNVWVPKDPRSSGKLPVMVWLHGGAFIFGSGSDAYYSGANLAAAQGVIVVNMSYRLGAFGFLAHPAFASEDPAYPSSGNWGIDDQFAALEWVQRNIEAFGGDRTKVTLFGESAGGYSACVHYVSPRTEGLFRAAISESGLCTTSVLELSRAEAETAAIGVADALGCTGADVAACLRGKTVQEFIDATNPIEMGAPPGGPFYQGGPPLVTLPNVDGFVIERSLRETFESGDFPSRPLILGATRDEGTLFHTSLFATVVADETEYREALARRFPASAIDEIVARYPVASFPNANRAIAEISGDAFFVCPARRTARAVAAKGAPTYYYSFQQEPSQAFMPDLGVFHSAEIPFLFATDPRYPLARAGDAGKPTADLLQAYWSQFATTMDPNHDGAPAWPAYERATEQHLVIDNDPTVGSAYKASLCDFWDGV
ncbi:MAG: carboxylesterase/lipase family protein [Kofleriaceae bacterium]